MEGNAKFKYSNTVNQVNRQTKYLHEIFVNSIKIIKIHFQYIIELF